MHAVPKMGPPGGPIFGTCFGSFFEVFCIKVAEAQRFGFNEALWLMAAGRATVPTLYACCLTNAVVQAVPFLGPCLLSSSFFEVFCIKVAEAQRFGFNEALWLMAAGRATREALLSEAGFENVFRTQNWARRRKLFCR